MKRAAAESIALVGLSLLIVCSPWAFGGVHARFQQFLFWAACGTAIPTALLILWDGPRVDRGRWPAVLLPLFGAAAWGLCQLAPLPDELHRQVTPQGNYWWHLPVEAGADGLPLGTHFTISLFPQATRRDLALLGLVTTIFLLSSTALTSRRGQFLLWGVVAVNGAVFALFGILQQLTDNGRIYWSVPLREGGHFFAAFVNRNHAAGYLNLCLAASLGGLIGLAMGRADGEAFDPDDFARARAWGSRWQRWTTGWIANLETPQLMGIFLTVLLASGVVSSLSRGGILALGCATLAAAWAGVRVRRAGAVMGVTVIVLLLGVVLALWVGRGALLQHRLRDTVAEWEQGSNSRIDHWQDVWATCSDFWRTGTGLGTYRYAYRPYETQRFAGWFHHAENQYLETLVVAGLPGLLLLSTAMLLVIWSAVRRLRADRDPHGFALGIATLFAVVSQAVHSFFDFGLYLPANAILMAALCGLGCAQLPEDDPGRGRRYLRPGWTTRLGQVVVWVLAGSWLVWGAWETRRAARMEWGLEQVRELSSGERVSGSAAREACRQLAHLVAQLPGDAAAHFRLGQLHALAYRGAAAEQLESLLGPSPAGLWQLTSPLVLHRRAHELAAGDAEGWEQLRRQPLVEAHLGAAGAEWQAALRACPILGGAYPALAEISPVVPGSGDESIWVRNAILLSPSDPQVLFRCGLLDLQAGRTEAGLSKWRKCLTLSGEKLDEILVWGEQFLLPEPLLESAIPDLPTRLLAVARRIAAPELRQRLTERAAAALEHSPPAAAEGLYLQAVIGYLQGDMERAVDCLGAAVAAQPWQVEWRYELATWLAEQGRWPEARHHAVLCLRQAPRRSKYRELWQRLKSTPDLR